MWMDTNDKKWFNMSGVIKAVSTSTENRNITTYGRLFIYSFNEKVPTEGYMVLVIHVHRVSFLHYRIFQCVLLVTPQKWIQSAEHLKLYRQKREMPLCFTYKGFLSLWMEYAEYECVWNECVKYVCENIKVVRVAGCTDCLWLLSVWLT